MSAAGGEPLTEDTPAQVPIAWLVLPARVDGEGPDEFVDVGDAYTFENELDALRFANEESLKYPSEDARAVVPLLAYGSVRDGIAQARRVARGES